MHSQTHLYLQTSSAFLVEIFQFGKSVFADQFL